MSNRVTTDPPGVDSLASIVAGWQGRPVMAVVDLDLLAANVRTLRDLIGPTTRLLAVVKANGYGHGAVPIARAALAAGAEELAVATVDEAAQLRGCGISAPLLVLGPIGQVDRPRAIGLGLGIVVSDAAFVDGLAADAKMKHRKEPVSLHLKIDTGMNRFGTVPERVVDIARAIGAHPELRLDAVMTHLADADDPDPAFAFAQAAVFDRCISDLDAAGITVPTKHIANSAATLRFPELHRDLVRVGIAMYGLRPDIRLPLPDLMRPILTIHGRISRLIDVPSGSSVGYGRTYRATGPHRAALIPIGYGDGYRRVLSSRGWMGLAGERADVLGRVSMDQTVIGVPDGLDVRIGDPVAVVGDGTSRTPGAPTLDELGDLAGTISYEMATGLAPRLSRLYLRGGEVVEVCDLHGSRILD